MKKKSIAGAVLVLAAVLLNSVTTPAPTQAQEVVIKIKTDGKTQTAVEKIDKPDKARPFNGTRPAVDVAILLDTSNSMDGLIGQAKSQLWTIVQQFAEAKKDGKTPELRVSVFEYGNSKLPASEDYIRQVIPLTSDLDKVSEGLCGLSTSGGDEYCGAVIGEALKRLDWSEKENSYKAIFIAGNEPFTQGGTDYRSTCKTAIEKGIVVNTIHCGNYQQGVSGKWKDGADLAEGEYLNIDQDKKMVHIESPQDTIIIELNKKLNKTYLWFGSDQSRQTMYENQSAQDENAASLNPGAALSRAKTKSSSVYNFSKNDLVDSLEESDEIVAELKDEQLPESMRGMSVEERKAHVEKVAADRREVQAELAKATAERDRFVAAKRKEMSASGAEQTLGDVMSSAVNRQLKASGFSR